MKRVIIFSIYLKNRLLTMSTETLKPIASWLLSFSTKQLLTIPRKVWFPFLNGGWITRAIVPSKFKFMRDSLRQKLLIAKAIVKRAKKTPCPRRSPSQARLSDEDEPEGVLYFIAKTLEEFSQSERPLSVYKRILSMETSNPELVQKIGSQFLSMGEYS